MCFSQSFLASGIVKFSFLIHVKVFDEDDEEAEEDEDDLVDGVPFNSLL